MAVNRDDRVAVTQSRALGRHPLADAEYVKPPVALIDRHAYAIKMAALLILHLAEFAPAVKARMRIERMKHSQYRPACQPLFVRCDGVIVFNELNRFGKISHGRIVRHPVAGSGKGRRIVTESADSRGDGDDQKRDYRDCGP